MAYNPRNHAPEPIIDNLSEIGNPYDLNYSYKTISTIPQTDITAVEYNEFIYVLRFLYTYRKSSATFNAYRRDLERLLQWAWHIEQRSLLTLRREDIEAFVEFNIKPPVKWIGYKNVARFKIKDGIKIINPEWRPYVVISNKAETKKISAKKHKNEDDKPVFVFSQSALKGLFTTIGSFFEFLVEEQQIPSNPVKAIRQKSKFIQKVQSQRNVKRITNLQWRYVIKQAETMADKEPECHERTLFIINCLLSMYLRVSELVKDERSTPTMGDFYKDHHGNWWLKVTGKGDKLRKVTVCDEMLDALKRYRSYLGLSPLPELNEKTPLISKHLGSGHITSTRQVRAIVKRVFDAAYIRMEEDNLKSDAEELKKATVHWLRHTGISEDVKLRPREHVRDEAGHASMATTDIYIDSDSKERHESGKRKRIRR